MHRRQFLSASLLAAPALMGLAVLPAEAATVGSTLLEAPGLSVSGSFSIPGFAANGNGVLNMIFANGPRVAAQVGPNAIGRMMTAGAGERIAIRYLAFNGAEDYRTAWTLSQVSAAGARAAFTVDGGLSADVSALVGGDQVAGAGLAAMILAAASAGSVLRASTATDLQALITVMAVPAGADFALEVTVRNA